MSITHGRVLLRSTALVKRLVPHSHVTSSSTRHIRSGPFQPRLPIHRARGCRQAPLCTNLILTRAARQDGANESMAEAILEGRGAGELCNERHNERSEETRSRRRYWRVRERPTPTCASAKSRQRVYERGTMTRTTWRSTWARPGGTSCVSRTISAKPRSWTQRSMLLKHVFDCSCKVGKRAIDF